MCATESRGRLSLLQHLKIHEGIEHQCDKCGYKSPSKKYPKDPINRIHSGINFQCNQCKRAFTEKGCLRSHTHFEHYNIHFFTWCDKCPIKGKTQDDLQKHILWIHEGKGPQCGLCE